MKKFLACVLSASMMLGLLAGCAGAGSSSGNAPAGSGAAVSTPAVSGDNVLKIGVFEPSTGDSASGGKKEMLGMQYANSETPTVTVGGQEYQIQLVYADNGSSTDKALTAATQLVSEGVSLVLGSYGSGVSIAAGPTFGNAGLPAIGVTCTNPMVTAGNDYYFRICFLDPFQGTVLANFAMEKFQAKTAYLLGEAGNEYDQGLINFFEQAFTAAGGKVIKDAFPTNNSDFNSYLNKAKAALDAAKQAQGVSDETAAEAAQEQRHAQEAVDEAQATVDAANAGMTIVTRTAGNEAEQTAVAIAQQVRPNHFGSIVIARSDDFADSMSATGLAGLLGAPILLINRFEGANAETLTEIARLNPIQAYVIGGPGAIPAMDKLNDQLRNAGVKRIENIYGDTSAKCGARICEIDDTIGNGTPKYTVVAMSDNFQDALSMSSFAYKYHAPVILLTSAPDARGRHLTAESAELLSSGALCDSNIFVAGGEGAVPNDALSREGLQAFKRLAGESGYDTSNQIACYMLESGLLSADTVTLACGAEEARGLDALAGAALAGKNSGPILLVNAQQAFGDTSLQTIKGADSERTAAFLDSHADAVYWIDVLGGEYVMPESLIENIRTIIR